MNKGEERERGNVKEKEKKDEIRDERTRRNSKYNNYFTNEGNGGIRRKIAVEREERRGGGLKGGIGRERKRKGEVSTIR